MLSIHAVFRDSAKLTTSHIRWDTICLILVQIDIEKLVGMATPHAMWFQTSVPPQQHMKNNFLILQINTHACSLGHIQTAKNTEQDTKGKGNVEVKRVVIYPINPFSLPHEQQQKLPSNFV